MDAKFIRTAKVLAGWTKTHPSIPPRPLDANTTDLGNGCCCCCCFKGGALPELLMVLTRDGERVAPVVAAADGGGLIEAVAMMKLLLDGWSELTGIGRCCGADVLVAVVGADDLEDDQDHHDAVADTDGGDCVFCSPPMSRLLSCLIGCRRVPVVDNSLVPVVSMSVVKSKVPIKRKMMLRFSTGEGAGAKSIFDEHVKGQFESTDPSDFMYFRF